MNFDARYLRGISSDSASRDATEEPDIEFCIVCKDFVLTFSSKGCLLGLGVVGLNPYKLLGVVLCRLPILFLISPSLRLCLFLLYLLYCLYILWIYIYESRMTSRYLTTFFSIAICGILPILFFTLHYVEIFLGIYFHLIFIEPVLVFSQPFFVADIVNFCIVSSFCLYSHNSCNFILM